MLTGGVLATPLVQHLLELHSGVQHVLSWDITSTTPSKLTGSLMMGG